ncbi:hypothetical protein [Rossellomorea sp. NPDC077527]|uniref:hypothetical protein n=1 Tax=Rossellomorea sp. NPDC077527 TaxID=3364510 RepID=UPI0037C9EF2C
MLKKAGVSVLFILICAVSSLLLMTISNNTTEKIKKYYYVEDSGGESNLSLGPGEEGRTLEQKRLDKPIEVDEPLPWFVDPFFGENGSSGKGILDAAKKYGVFVVLTAAWLLLYHRRKKKRKEKKEDIAQISNNQHVIKQDQLEPLKDGVITLSEEKLNEIRQMLKDWETQLNIINRKKNHETIQEWFKRIKGPTEVIPVYEKVRYGGKSFTHKEIRLLKKLLK